MRWLNKNLSAYKSQMTISRQPIDTFKANVAAVERLMQFDRDVQDLVIEQIKQLNEALIKNGIHNEKLNGKYLLNFLGGIRENDSMRPRYELIFNQAVVLLVSHFGSALSDLFRLATAQAILGSDKRVMSEELNIEVEELIGIGEQIESALGDMIIQKKDISFQDMKSVSRAFKKYFGIEIDKDPLVNNIIMGQASRHAIVHDGGRANSRFMRQIHNALPRTLQIGITENSKISFKPNEVKELANDMQIYVEKLHQKIVLYSDKQIESAL